jgi:hypothetical protein
MWILRKAHNLLWACRWVCGVRWGLRPKVVHCCYVAFVEPSISFAFLVWWPGFNSRPIRFGLVVENVTLGQVLLRALWSPPPLATRYYHSILTHSSVTDAL